MANEKYRSFTESFDGHPSIDRFIERTTGKHSPEYRLFDFSVLYRGSSSAYPYVVTVVLERVDGPSPRNGEEI